MIAKAFSMTARAKSPFRVLSSPADAGRRVDAGEDCRCACGNLLGRVVPEGIELKCRRCKRTFVLPVEEAAR